MRTTASNQWVWVFAGALPALGALGSGCGDDSTATTTSSTTSEGGFGGFGDTTSTTSSSTSSGPTTTGTTSGQTTTTTTTTATTSGQTSSSSSSQGGGGSGQGGEGGSAAECGNGLLEAGEACDSDSFGDDTCASEGFVSGTLGCTDDCELDTSSCESCGDNVANFGDECDGDDLAESECSDVGDFIGGTLACNSDCTFDTDACVGAQCDDGEINGSEECDGALLDDETCETQGYVSGTLACSSPSCQFDTSACVSCGDNVANFGDECDGTDLGIEDCLTLGHTGGTIACDGTCLYNEAGCTDFPLPIAGEVVITELMMNPTGTPVPFPDASAEWIEITNPSLSLTYQLNGCVVSSNNDGPFTIATDLSVAPGATVTLSKSNPGFTSDFTYPDAFNLANGGDFVTIACDGIDVDTVDYGAAGFTVPAGRSLSLDPGSIDATDNDDGANWCAASTTSVGFTSGDQGTPGETNPACGAGNLTIDDCRLQFPTTINDVEGTSVDIFGRVLVTGVTDVNQTGNDNSPGIMASVGFGPDGSDPSANLTGWVFSAAIPNVGYTTASPGFEPTFDEYQGAFNIPAASGSPYDFAVRFSGDGGTTWRYCDTNAGAYAAVNAGQMTAQVSNVDYDLFFSEYIEAPAGNGSNKVLELYNAGAAVDLGACELRLYNDGSGTPNNVVDATSVLSGTLAANDTLVICNNLVDQVDPPELCDLRIVGGVMNFNGDDTIGIWCASNPIDVIGQIGVDPGTLWGAGPPPGAATANMIMRRDCDVTVGDSNPDDAYDPTGEWTGFAYDSTTMDADLGQPYCP